MSFLYLLCLAASFIGVGLLDHRYRLMFWRGRDRLRVLFVVLLGTFFFLIWDLCGIGLGIFFRGESPVMTGVEILPELPLEEPIFLLFLCYLTLVLISAGQKIKGGLQRGPGRVEGRL